MSLIMKATKSDVSTISGTDRKMVNGTIIVVISIHNLFVKRLWNEVSENFFGKKEVESFVSFGMYFHGTTINPYTIVKQFSDSECIKCELALKNHMFTKQF